MLTDPTVTSVTIGFALSPHERRSASRTPRRESATSNATQARPHTATAETRHTYATWLLRRGAGMESVRQLLGHVSITTTIDAYGHLTVEDARATLEAAGWFTGQEVHW
jgi:site-specific recombinase XerD